MRFLKERGHQGVGQSKNILNIGLEDKVLTFMKVKTLSDEEFINNNYILFATKKGG